MNKLYITIKAIRVEKGLTQIEVAEKMKMTQGNYARLERGETAMTIERLEQLADVFEMSVSNIYAYNEDNKVDYNEDFEYYINKSIKLEKKIKDLESQINDEDEFYSILNKKLEHENKELKSTIKTQAKKIQDIEELFKERLSQKDLIIREKDNSINDKNRMIEMQERTIKLYESKT